MIRVSDIITFRKLMLIRAFRLRLGENWASRLRGAGFRITGSQFCSPTHWDDALDRLETFARGYGFVDPLDDTRPLADHCAALAAVLAKDAQEALRFQSPDLHPTAGTMEPFDKDPSSCVSLADSLASEFGLVPTSAPAPSKPVNAKPRPSIHVSSKPSAFETAILASAGTLFADAKAVRAAEKAYAEKLKRARRKASASAKKAASRAKKLREAARLS